MYITLGNLVSLRDRQVFPEVGESFCMVVVIDSTDLDLGKQAYSQMKDFGVDPEVVQTEALNIPRTISEKEGRYFLVALDTSEEFAEQIVAKVLDLEEDNHVVKVFIKKENESREVFERKAKSLTREKAEDLAEKVK
jgi:uncharacterized UPF0160 family protein